MELLLNLIWLVVVTSLAVALVRYRLRRDPSRRSVLTVLCSLVCISVLLFPAISVSDDLYVQWMASESPVKLMSQLFSASQNDEGELLAFAAALLLALLLLAIRRELRVEHELENFSPLDGVLSVICGRAPPEVA